MDINVHRGAITAIIGPNASGKTTFNRILLGLVRPDAGEILMDGVSIRGQSAYRGRIGYMQQAARFPENLCAGDVFGMITEQPGATGQRDTEMIESLDLEQVLRTPIRQLSGGMRQRVNAALAFLLQPDLLILDEPTAALDPVSSSILKDKMRAERSRGRTFILTSHVLSELQELADRIVFLLDGSVRFAGRPEELLREAGEQTLERAVATLMRAHDHRPRIHHEVAA
ncbi:MAG: ABC transporter ATP-binding protein [Gemmatimonadaceae bacterium]